MSAVPVEGDRERLAREISRALTLLRIEGNQRNDAYGLMIADYLVEAGVSLTGSGLDVDALRAAMIEAIFDTPMHPVKPSTAQLVDSILSHSMVRAALSGESGELDSAYRMALAQIEHDGEVINRLTRALRVATHSPHDQAGKPNEGFPTCSDCGAIQTGESGEPRYCVLAVLHQGLHRGADGSEWSWFETTHHSSPPTGESGEPKGPRQP